MNPKLFFFGKILLKLLILFSMGNYSLYSFPVAQVQEERPGPLEKLHSLQHVPGAARQTSYEEHPDLSKSPFGDMDQENLSFRRSWKLTLESPAQPVYTRDLRAAISIYLFPTHFFI